MDEEGGLRGEVVITYLSNVLSFIEQRILQNISLAAKQITDLDWSCRIMIQTGHVELALKRNASF